VEELSGLIHSDAADSAEHNSVIDIMQNIVCCITVTVATVAIAKRYDNGFEQTRTHLLCLTSGLVGVLLLF